MEKIYRLLIINPGSTSTKLSLFENKKELFQKSQFHDAPVLLQFPHVNGQVPFRYQVILDMLKEEGVDPSDIDVFVGRGGSACTQPSGVTIIDQKLYDDTEAAVGGSEHAAKLGVMLAWRFAQNYHKPAYTLNPTNVDEYCDYARLTGIRGLYRTPHSHVLNPKAVAIAHAESMGKRYEDCNFIVGHIDGGVTVSTHYHGKMIDGTMGADGDGPFAPPGSAVCRCWNCWIILRPIPWMTCGECAPGPADLSAFSVPPTRIPCTRWWNRETKKPRLSGIP